jgi:hypothetical protein
MYLIGAKMSAKRGKIGFYKTNPQKSSENMPKNVLAMCERSNDRVTATECHILLYFEINAIFVVLLHSRISRLMYLS